MGVRFNSTQWESFPMDIAKNILMRIFQKLQILHVKHQAFLKEKRSLIGTDGRVASLTGLLFVPVMILMAMVSVTLFPELLSFGVSSLPAGSVIDRITPYLRPCCVLSGTDISETVDFFPVLFSKGIKSRFLFWKTWKNRGCVFLCLYAFCHFFCTGRVSKAINFWKRIYCPPNRTCGAGNLVEMLEVEAIWSLDASSSCGEYFYQWTEWIMG